MSEPTDIEKKNLEAHVELCAERYRHLETKLQAVDEKIDGMEKVIREVHDMIANLKDAKNSQTVAWAAGVISVLAAMTAWFATQYFSTL